MLIALVGASAPRTQALVAANAAVPAPVQISALVDTGATGTVIDPSVMQTLGLTPTGTVNVITPTTGSTPVPCPQFDIALVIPGATANDPPLIFQTIPVIASELLAPQGIHALIGRDILDQCFFVYNGGVKQFTLAY